MRLDGSRSHLDAELKIGSLSPSSSSFSFLPLSFLSPHLRSTLLSFSLFNALIQPGCGTAITFIHTPWLQGEISFSTQKHNMSCRECRAIQELPSVFFSPPHIPPQLRRTPTMTSSSPRPSLFLPWLQGTPSTTSVIAALFLIQGETFHSPVFAIVNETHFSLDSKLGKNYMFIVDERTEIKIKYQVTCHSQMNKRGCIALKKTTN